MNDGAYMGLAIPAILAVSAIAALLLPLFRKKLGPAVMSIVLGSSIAALLLIPFIDASSEFSFFRGAIVLGGFSVYMWTFALASLSAVLVLSLACSPCQRGMEGDYSFLLTMSALGLMIISATNDLLSFFIALELMSIPAYALTGIRKDARGTEAAYKYFMLGAMGSAFIALGLALINHISSSLDITLIRIWLVENSEMPFPVILAAGLGLLMAGFAFKSAIAPFHMWVPDVYEGAPAQVGAFMGTAVKAGGIISLLRIAAVFPGEMVYPLFWILSAATIILANLMALPQTRLKRLLAYSSVSHAGYIIMGAFDGRDGMAGALFYLPVYALSTIGAFASVTLLESDERPVEIKDISGLAEKQPLLAAAIAIFMFSLTGIPPLAGFFAKFNILGSALKSGQTLLVTIAAAASAVSAYYYLRVVIAMYMGEPAAESPTPAKSVAASVLIAAMVLGAVIFGIFPELLMPLAREAAQSIF